MAEQEIANIMRDCVKTLETGDVDKSLSFFTEDAVWVSPVGTFKGKDELRSYLSTESMQHMTITEAGNGIILQGNKAFFEHVIATTFQGRKLEGLVMCAYEFKGDKIQAITTVYDRLLVAKQAAKGWLAKKLVNSIVKQTEKL